MKSSVLLSMCLVMTIYFANGVAPLPKKVGASITDCKCPDGSNCLGTKSCSCVTGTCTSEACGQFDFLLQAKKPDAPGTCDCDDGSHCFGKNCKCDEETGACSAENDCDEDPSDPTEDPIDVDTTEAPIDDPTEDPIDDPTEDPIDDPTEDPIDDPTEDPIDDPTEDPIDDPTEDPIDDPTEDPIDDTTEE